MILAAVSRGGRVEHYETTRVRKDGRLVRIGATVVAIRDENGLIIGASKIVRDLTERDAHQHRIQELQAELAHVQRLTELGQVISKLVHEINQPITALKNYLNGCRRLAAAGNQTGIKSALDQMGSQIDRTSQIIRRVRDYVRKRDMQMQPERLSSVIREAVELTRSSFRGQELVFNVRVEPEDLHALIDRIQIQQVLFNLMRNAVEAMLDRPRREIVLTAQSAQKDMVEIGVADNGSGLLEIVRKQLFQPFVTTKPNGMGIGLSVCQGIVELHEGRLWADENVGPGTDFHFTVRNAAQRQSRDGPR